MADEQTIECSVVGCHNEAERIQKVVGHIPLAGGKTREEEVYVVVCPTHFASDAAEGYRAI